MLLFKVLSYFACLLQPAFTSAHFITPKDPANIAAHNVKSLSNPLKNLLHKRNVTLFAGVPNASNALALNSTVGDIAEAITFEEQINIPEIGGYVYFFIKGEIDTDSSVTVELWVHYQVDRRIGVFYGNLKQGVDMKIPDGINFITGEARLYALASAEYDVIVFEAYGNIRIPHKPPYAFRPFLKEIKRWKVGDSESIQDVPSSLG